MAQASSGASRFSARLTVTASFRSMVLFFFLFFFHGLHLKVPMARVQEDT
jgi:hypothetical protein